MFVQWHISNKPVTFVTAEQLINQAATTFSINLVHLIPAHVRFLILELFRRFKLMLFDPSLRDYC